MKKKPLPTWGGRADHARPSVTCLSVGRWLGPVAHSRLYIGVVLCVVSPETEKEKKEKSVLVFVCCEEEFCLSRKKKKSVIKYRK